MSAFDAHIETGPQDDSVPHAPLAMPAARVLWETVTARAQAEINRPALWLAMQAAQVDEIKDGVLYVTLSKDLWYLAEQLETQEIGDDLRRILKEASHHNLSYAVRPFVEKPARTAEGEAKIENVTVDDSDRQEQQAMDFAADSLLSEAMVPDVMEPPIAPSSPPPATSACTPQTTSAEEPHTWDKLMERVSKGLSSAPFKQYPQGRARYMLESIELIASAVDAISKESPQSDDVLERHLYRVIDRLAQAVDMDPLYVALELERYRKYAS
jgi:hypothetical protein